MQRLLCAILIGFGFLLSLGAAPALAADSGPTLVSISAASKPSVGIDTNISWNIAVSSSTGSALQSATLEFLVNDTEQPGIATSAVEATAAGTSLVGSPVVNGTVTVSGSTSFYQESGDFELARVILVDVAGHQTDWLRDGSVTGDIGAGSGAPPFSQADFQVTNSHPDTQAPVITSIALQTASTINAGEPVVVSVAATDDLSGVNQISMTLYGPANTSLFLAPMQGGGGDNQTFSVIVPAHIQGGTYTMGAVGATDLADNSSGVNPAQVPGGPITIQVVSPQPDTTPPSIISLGGPLPTTAPGGAIGTHYVVSDNYPGDLTFELLYRYPGQTTSDPLDYLRVERTCDNWDSIVSGQTFSTTMPGTYQLESIGIADSAGNTVGVNRDGTESTFAQGTGGAPGTTVVVPHSGIDLSQSDMSTKKGAPVDNYGYAIGSGCDDTDLTATASGGGIVGTVMRGTSPVVNPVLSVLTPSSHGAATIVHGNAKGQFSDKAVPVGSTVHFFGGLDARGGVAQPATTTVAKTWPAAGVTYRTARIGSTSRPRLRVAVTVRNGKRGDVVALEALHGKTWRTVTYLHANAKKQASLSVPLPFRLPLRVDVPGTREHRQQIIAIGTRLLR